MHIDPTDAGPCALCGRPWSDVDNGSGWLNLEIVRSDGRDGLDYLSEDFCSQAHAATWLSRPLPPISGPYEPSPLPLTWQDRLLDTAFGVALLVALALAGFGAYSLLRLVIG